MTATAEPMLELTGVGLMYGGLVALSCVDLSVESGRVTGLIGPNGAGKTSLFDVVTGLARPSSGRVLLRGTDVTRHRTARRARMGLARTFQRLELFSSLTVAENLAVVAELAQRPRFKPAKGHLFTSDVAETVTRLLESLGLDGLGAERADTLPTGTARLLEVARALAGSPKLLLLDEPASGLNRSETDRLADLITSLSATGLAVLLVEHDVELVMRICTDVYVLDRGQVICHGPPATVKADPLVRDAYLGQMVLDG